MPFGKTKEVVGHSKGL